MRKSQRVTVKKISYKDDEDGGDDEGEKDFEDSGSEASIHNEDASEESNNSSGNEFVEKNSPVIKKSPFKKNSLVIKNPSVKKKSPRVKKQQEQRQSTSKFTGKILKQISQSMSTPATVEMDTNTPFTVKDLTEQEKLLPDFLNLSESDSDSDCENEKSTEYSAEPLDYKSFLEKDIIPKPGPSNSFNEVITGEKIKNELERLSDSDSDSEMVDVSKAASVTAPPKKLQFQNIFEHNKKFDEVKKSLEIYNKKHPTIEDPSCDVNALLAMGETHDVKNFKNDNSDFSDSDNEDLEEVKGERVPQVNIPKGGIQVVVDLPAGVKKSKKLDIEMMMKRRINRVKKEYQVYMHKVHVLSWIAHGNYLNKIVNNMDLMAAALSLIPSEHCYPSNRINLKYLEQICKWYYEALDVKEDRNEFKYRPNKQPLDISLMLQINKKLFTSNKSKVLIFISLLRALGVKCRLVLSFCVVSLRPPVTELCSLTSKKENIIKEGSKYFKSQNSKENTKKVEKSNKAKNNSAKKTDKIPQLDGADDGDRSKTRSHNTRAKKLSLIKKDSVKKHSPKPPDNVSYWDQITKNVIESDDERVSHKDLTKVVSPSRLRLNTPAAKNTESLKIKSKSIGKKVVSVKNNQNVASSSNVKGKSLNINSKEQSKNAEKSKSTAKSGENNSKRKLSNSNASISALKKKAKTSDYFVEEKQNPKTKIINSDSKIKISEKKSGVKKKTTSEYFEDDKKPTLKGKSGITRNRRDSNTSDVEFVPNKKRSISKVDRRVLSTDDDHSQDEKKKKGINIWCEVYVEEEEQWISVDILKGQVHCLSQIYNRARHPVSYVVTWDNNGHIKDVTRRYVPHWNTTTRKLRTNATWYEAALRPWMAPAHLRDRREDEQLDRLQLDAPMPQTVSEFKNHPLYALKRHLLKFEVIYPSNAPTLGFVRNEAVYARECVHICRSRETWVKEAKVVRPGETPYKIVKARPKYDKLSGKCITDIPLEIFGPWQVDDYIPPTAEDGKVPRNPYGNVELFKPCMLPGGTVHLSLPGLNRVAKKLNIDCASAMVGFDYHTGGSHPVYDGFVVCEEFKEVIIAAWEQEQEEAGNRAREKIEKRVYGNWRRIIRGLFIRKRLQAKYAFQLETEPENLEVKKTKKSKK
ncbi:DNA repair protein complementing XP-C cells homolog [Arctopsyche grandis]|uniref:DNA repair protein complementing XP-C cells homolog n=1 Tax=Arctopsyche grandis TaxID=121162 RepID=UPI00406D923C